MNKEIGKYACYTAMIICVICSLIYNNLIIGIGGLMFGVILVFYYYKLDVKCTKDKGGSK